MVCLLWRWWSDMHRRLRSRRRRDRSYTRDSLRLGGWLARYWHCWATIWVHPSCLVCDLCLHDEFCLGNHFGVALVDMVVLMSIVQRWEGGG